MTEEARAIHGAGMKVTYFVEVFSSWCYWAEPAWAELKTRYADRAVQFDWKIALMHPEAFPTSREQCDWFYRRSGTIMGSPFMLNSGWIEPERQGHYEAPNLVAEAARSLGVHDDRVRLALAAAAMREGKTVADLESAVKVASVAGGLDGSVLRRAATSPEIEKIVRTSTEEFHRHQIAQRPAFILEDEIGDKAVFSGLAKIEPLAATIEAMLADAAAYATHRAHFGSPPN